MEAVLKRPVWPRSSETLRSFANWLLCWLVLANAGFWLMWAVGGPSRGIQIVATGCIGLALHRAPFAVKFLAFVAVTAYSVLNFTAGMFNLNILSLLYSMQAATELEPSASPEYVAAFIVIVGTLLCAWRFLQRSTVLGRPALLVAAISLTFGLALIDRAIASAHAGSYHRAAAEGAAFGSAVQKSGLATSANGRRHVLIVMVESMGQPTDPAIRARLQNIWARPEVRARYDVLTGESPYYGSTTSGEMRELCGRWGEYAEVMNERDGRCLPAILGGKGYHSQGWHSFTGEFFDRKRWYPNVGFDEMRFGDRLLADGAQRCPGVFPGACDRDVPAQIGAALKTADTPQFIYWLTVNSHLPVLKQELLGTENCAAFDVALDRDFPMICRFFQLIGQTGDALGREITAPGFPETDILIVGDHIPPFFDRRHREQFEPDRVPWILLRPKSDPTTGIESL